MFLCVCACAFVCVRVCVRACVRACVRVRVHALARWLACVCDFFQGFTVEADTLTPTLKLRRPQLLQRYQVPAGTALFAKTEQNTKPGHSQ